MKLQVKHSKKYLAKDNNGRAIQNIEADEWVFVSDNNEEINPKLGDYGRIILKESKKPSRCWQPSSDFPRDGWLIDLAPVQIGNDSQFWRFILEDEDEFYVIENKNERREKGRNIRIKKACMDVCEAKMSNNIIVIVYHINGANGSDNQRWKIINTSDEVNLDS
ncbi:RICIN domain-containing protein [Thiothrix winogradskyi]|uniref:RICIN domain-containing protein n=1 Tax=Thiothrix winogradskyi TaxID=96472 RepID=A0ABY3T5P4_9GAMM|nr:RICIN domain-containing protein [Thiothrix winogradskyi]UJS26006.1 RICIN domain-containing protein [Thiothrix winogradskyi]